MLNGDEEAHDIADIPAHLENATIKFGWNRVNVSFENVIDMRIEGNNQKMKIRKASKMRYITCSLV